MKHLSQLAFLAVLGLILAAPLAAQPVPPSVDPNVAVQPACPLPIDPIPSGPVGRPAELFNSPGDYDWVHSGTHLQGEPAHEKWAWGFYNPPGRFSGFRTAVIVNNPFPGTTAIVDIEYRDTAGTLLATTFGVVIGPECFHTEQATPLAAAGGLGSIRVIATDATTPFVAATIHHSYTFAGQLDTDFLSPGLASMQQFQKVQPQASTLYAGPFPVTTLGADPLAFNNGNLPTFQVINPNPFPVNLNVTWSSPQLGGVFNTAVVPLARFGSYMDLWLFNALVPLYVPPTPLNLDVVVTVTSDEGPILGEQLMLDFFDQSSDMNPFTRFRMGSAMMESTPSYIVLNPELTHTSAGPPVNTLMAIANVGAGNAGPVRIQYRSQGGVLAVDVVPNLPPGGVVRIGPGQPLTPNYPAPPFWDGTTRILGCNTLIGWTMREIEPDPNGFRQQFRKVYGETLDNTTGAEPGDGFVVTTLGQNLVRKASPIERIAWPFAGLPWWPGYNAIANYSVSNIGNYWFRSFAGTGAPLSCAESTNFAPQPFAGLPWSQASFTFKDGVATPLALPPFTVEHLGTVDHQDGSIIGIDVIGDPLEEWGLGFPPYEPGDPGTGDLSQH